MKRMWIVVFITLFIISVIIDVLRHNNGDQGGGLLGSHMPGIFALFGFIGCVGVIAVSKLIGHYWLQRKEDYYDRKDKDD